MNVHEIKKELKNLGIVAYKLNNKTVFFKKDIVAALQNITADEDIESGVGDIKGTEPGGKDILRLEDIKRKGGNDVNKIIKLVQTMANSIGRGAGADSKEKALRRAKAAEMVFEGEFGKMLANIFKEAA